MKKCVLFNFLSRIKKILVIIFLIIKDLILLLSLDFVFYYILISFKKNKKKNLSRFK